MGRFHVIGSDKNRREKCLNSKRTEAQKKDLRSRIIKRLFTGKPVRATFLPKRAQRERGICGKRTFLIRWTGSG